MQILSQQDIIAHLNTPVFRQLTIAADAANLPCYVVGGYVRDLLLGRSSKDIDVVVVGSGIAMAEAFVASVKGKAHIAVFRRYGTAQVKWHGQEIEFVGARKESYTPDSRNPQVEEGTIEDDQNRRDFTINALAICLNKDRLGELVDPFDGVLDLEDGIIRTPLDPDITFSDDPLRIFRCVRFATQLRFQIDDETREALERNAERIKIVSAERIYGELQKIIMADTPSRGFAEMQYVGILKHILPELSRLDIVETRNGRKHKNNFYHTLEVLDNVARHSDNEWLRWAALLHDIGKTATKRWDNQLGWTFHNHNFIGEKMVPAIFRRLKMPLDDRMRYVKKLVGLHMRPIVIADEIVTDSAVRRLLFDAGNDIDDLMTLCEADITSKNEVRKQTFLNNFRIVREKLVQIEEKDRIRNFQPPVDGNEIMTLFQLPPCHEVGILKTALKDAILDGEVHNDHDEALAFILEKAKTIGLEPCKPINSL